MLDIYFMTDQPETCGLCGARTEWVDNADGTQTHTCLDCRYVYILEEDNEEMDC